MKCSALGLLLVGVFFTLTVPPVASQTTPPFTQCPPVGADTSCAILLVIEKGGSLRVKTDPSQGPFDRIEDTLIGVQNNSDQMILSIPLTAAIRIFAFDGDGICGSDPFTGLPLSPRPAGCPFGPTLYEGPRVSFANINASRTSGTVNFTGGIPPGKSAYFSLEERIETQCPSLNGIVPLKQFRSPWETDTYDHDYYTSNFSDANITTVSSTGTMQLVVFPHGTGQPPSSASIAYKISLTPTTNNLNGLRDAINGLKAGVTAIVLSKAVQKTNTTVYFLSLTVPTSTADAVQLLQTPGDSGTNILQTIKRYGCYLTASAMVFNYYAALQGIPTSTTPRELNNWLNDNDGYLGDLVDPSAVVQFAKQRNVVFGYVGRRLKRDDFTLDSYLCQRNPVLLNVRYVSSTGEVLPHVVLATGQTTVGTQDTYSISDPGSDHRTTLEPYQFEYSGLRLFTTNQTSPSSLYAVAHSPINLFVTDPQGRRTGIDPLTGSPVNEIPESSYGPEFLADDIDPTNGQTTAELKIFELLTPTPGSYSVQALGTDVGMF